MTYPRYRNGYVDDGSPVKASNRRDNCPNCGSSRYIETVSMERCDSCGLRMDYWGGGSNEVYDQYLAREHARQRAAEEERDRKEREEWERWQNGWNSDDEDAW